MLHLDGVVYKPCQGASTLTANPQPSRGDKEREFYEHTNNVGHPITAHLPKYLGFEAVIDEEGVERMYLKLEDITRTVCRLSYIFNTLPNASAESAFVLMVFVGAVS
jgi:hypothetical protein